MAPSPEGASNPLPAVSGSGGGPGPDQRAHFVTFGVDGRAYALPLDQVGRALRMVALIPVPEAPPWIAGLMNLQGQVVPVLDIRKRFGRPSRDPRLDDRLLVVQRRAGTYALMVDEVKDVLAYLLSEMEAPAGALAGACPLQGVIRHREDLILVLDPARLEPGTMDLSTEQDL